MIFCDNLCFFSDRTYQKMITLHIKCGQLKLPPKDDGSWIKPNELFVL